MTGLATPALGWAQILIGLPSPSLVALLARSFVRRGRYNPVGWVGLLVGLGRHRLPRPAAPLLPALLVGRAPPPWASRPGPCANSGCFGAAVAMRGGHRALPLLPWPTAIGGRITGWPHADRQRSLCWRLGDGHRVLDPGAAPFWRAWSRIDWGLMTYASLLAAPCLMAFFSGICRQGISPSSRPPPFSDPCCCFCGVLLDERLFPLQWRVAGWPWGRWS